MSKAAVRRFQIYQYMRRNKELGEHYYTVKDMAELTGLRIEGVKSQIKYILTRFPHLRLPKQATNFGATFDLVAIFNNTPTELNRNGSNGITEDL